MHLIFTSNIRNFQHSSSCLAWNDVTCTWPGWYFSNSADKRTWKWFCGTVAVAIVRQEIFRMFTKTFQQYNHFGGSSHRVPTHRHWNSSSMSLRTSHSNLQCCACIFIKVITTVSSTHIIWKSTKYAQIPCLLNTTVWAHSILFSYH